MKTAHRNPQSWPVTGGWYRLEPPPVPPSWPYAVVGGLAILAVAPVLAVALAGRWLIREAADAIAAVRCQPKEDRRPLDLEG
jgi:hypothetical protein